jgi:3-hydroxybutyryl-CoA dehydrogenase
VTAAPPAREESLTVIGGGTMGRGIAGLALRAGFPTTVVDVDEPAVTAARDAIERRLARDLGPGEATGRLRRLRLTSDLEHGVADATIVIEAVPELDRLKEDVFRRLASAAPEAELLATNTSTMSVSRLATVCGGSPRVVGMHFFNPVHRMALVEVVAGDATGAGTIGAALTLARALGKDPILVRDVPGFVTSRLGLLLGNEAMRLVEEGVASPADVDKAMRLGYGHPMGPLELADLVGLDARLNNLRSMSGRAGPGPYEPPALLERLVAEGRFGRKTGSGFYDYDDQGRVLGAVEDLP